MALSKISENGWTRIAEFRSTSNPSTWYKVGVRTLKDGVEQVGCDCPGWRNAKATGVDGHKKPCKHVKAIQEETFRMMDCNLTKEGADFFLQRVAKRGHVALSPTGT